MTVRARNRMLFAALYVLVVAFGVAATRRSGGTATRPPAEHRKPAAVARPDATPAARVSDAFAAAQEAIRANQMEEARDRLLEVAATDPMYEPALHNLGVVYEKLGDLGGSRDTFARLVERRPGDPEAWLGLGWAHYRLGDAAEAEAATRRSLESAPQHVLALYNLGLYRIAQDRLQEALGAYQRALGLDRERRQVFAAVNDLRELHGRSPQLASVHFALALFANVLGWPDQEVVELEHYLELAPAGPLAAPARVRLEAARAKTP